MRRRAGSETGEGRGLSGWRVEVGGRLQRKNQGKGLGLFDSSYRLLWKNVLTTSRIDVDGEHIQALDLFPDPEYTSDRSSDEYCFPCAIMTAA